MANNEQHCKLIDLFLRHKNPKSLTINDNEGTHMKSNAIQGNTIANQEKQRKPAIIKKHEQTQ